MSSSPLPINKPIGLAPSKNCTTLERSSITGFYMATKVVHGKGGVKLPVCACSIDRRSALCECHKRAKRAEEGLK